MLRHAGALARVLIIIVIIAATLATPAGARRHAYAQVKCVGLYCAIVSVRGPPSPSLRRGRPRNAGRGLTRIHTRSLRGYGIRNPHGS